MLCKQKRTQLPIITIDFVVENKTRRQLTNHSVTGVLCSNLDLNTAGEKPSLSVLVEIFVGTQLMQLVKKNYSDLFHVLNLSSRVNEASGPFFYFLLIYGELSIISTSLTKINNILRAYTIKLWQTYDN